MPKLSAKPHYQPRTIDQKIVEAACQWNLKPERGSERAGFIGLSASPDSGWSDLLRYISDALNERGFKAIYLDAARNYSDQVKSTLAGALHGKFAENRFRVLRYKIREFWDCA